MSITLELSPELEASIKRAAQQHGTDPQLYIIEAAQQRLMADNEVVDLSVPGIAQFTTQEPKTRSFGFLKGRMNGSSDDFLAEKHAQIKQERAKEEAGA